MKTYTVTYIINIHINAVDEIAALEIARETLPSSFDVIDEEVKESEEQETE